MNIKTRNLKNGSENSVIIIILASLLVIVLAIVGVYVAKDNQGIATFDGGKVTKSEYKIYYKMFSSYLQYYYGYDKDQIPYQVALKAATDKMILTDAKADGVTLSDEDKQEVDKIFNDDSYINYFKTNGFDIDELRKILDSAKFVKYLYIKLRKCDKINPLFKVFFKEYMAAIYLSSMGR